MSESTNSLVAKSKRLVIPAGVTAAALLGVVLLVGHQTAQAASSAAMPMDDSSVSSLVSLDNAVEAVAARVTPAVVSVSVTAKVSPDQAMSDGGQGQQQLPPGFQQYFFGFGSPFGGQGAPQQPQVEHGIGSGIIISPDGYILTNHHVVDNATQIRVTMHDRRVFPAKLVGEDQLNDLAVIKIDAKNLPSIAWGDSTKLRPGQTVLAFGSPFGYFQFSVTRGIISALDRPNPFTDNPRRPGDFIQTDAAINPGNSGGPLVDAHGELIGINTFIITNSGQFAGAGFAIPSEIARASAESIIKTGTVQHGYLGIAMNDVTPDNASFFSLPDASGAIVSQVSPDSPASRAGLKTGDVLRELNGKRIVNGSALQVAVTQIAPGNTIDLGILRNGKPETVKVQLGKYHANTEVADSGNAGNAQHARLGLGVGNLTSDMRQQFSIPSQVDGVAIESVRPASPADDAGLAPGDVILEVNRKPVHSADSFVSDVHALRADKDILLLVWSHGGASYRVVHPSANTDNGM